MDPKFKVGDAVRVTKKINAKGIGWPPEMDCTVGKAGTVQCVSTIHSAPSYNVVFPDADYNWNYPEEALELEPLEYKYPETKGVATFIDPPILKDTNPKDAIGSTKLPLDLVPDTMPAYAALAFLEGATKYGSMNWRVAGVRASIYMAAAKRHMAKYWNGEWADPKTKVPHLASAMACMAIILDADAAGKLTDDRPPKVDLSSLIDGMEANVKHLKELHKDYTPKHHYAKDQS